MISTAKLLPVGNSSRVGGIRRPGISVKQLPRSGNRLLVVKAASDESKDRSEEESRAAAARLEALEARIRGGATPLKLQEKRDKQAPPPQKVTSWREGQLFPDGWDKMPIDKKLSELYVGERGFLFWLNKLAYGAIFVLIGGWIVFRFVGPALGLYQLAGDAQF